MWMKVNFSLSQWNSKLNKQSVRCAGKREWSSPDWCKFGIWLVKRVLRFLLDRSESEEKLNWDVKVPDYFRHSIEIVSMLACDFTFSPTPLTQFFYTWSFSLIVCSIWQGSDEKNGQTDEAWTRINCYNRNNILYLSLRIFFLLVDFFNNVRRL